MARSMQPHPTEGQETSFPPRSGWLNQVLRRYFVAGLATLFPVTVTVFLVWQIFKFADGFLGRLLGFQLPGLGLVVTILVILIVGVFSVHLFGRVVFRALEVWLKRLPLVRKI